MSITSTFFARRAVAATAAMLVAGLLGASLIAGGPASAATKYATTTDSTAAAAGWLSTQLAGKTNLPQPGGNHLVEDEFDGVLYVNYGENADLIFGLAAAKSSSGAIAAAYKYLSSNVKAYADVTNKDGFGPYDGAVAKTALAAIVAGKKPTSVGGFNLMKTLQKDECPAAATTCTPGSAANIFAGISESFVILAEARTGGIYAPSTAAVNYFLSLQCSNGGFTAGTTACGAGAADVDSTSYAIMALQALGGHAAALTSAVNWLHGQQQSGGYWIEQGIPNADSTGLAAAALAPQGVNVSTAQAWLRSQQVGAGHPGAGAIIYDGAFDPSTPTSTSFAVLATAQALTGFSSGGSLATVSATGATSQTELYAPTASAPASVAQASSFTVTGAGFVAGEVVKVVVKHPASTTVGSATVGPDGTVTVSAKLPASVKAGAFTLVVSGRTSGLSAQRPITVS
jgi:hypothetical protein